MTSDGNNLNIAATYHILLSDLPLTQFVQIQDVCWNKHCLTYS